MSRVGQKPIPIPDGVSVEVSENGLVVKGALGVLPFHPHELISVSVVDGCVEVKPKSDAKLARSLWGMSRSVLDNLLRGVSVGFKQELELSGVGYKAQVVNGELILSLGYSKDVTYRVPSGVSVLVSGQKHDRIIVSGIDLCVVGQVVAEICAFRTVEPYKGKGIRPVGQVVVRKESKK